MVNILLFSNARDGGKYNKKNKLNKIKINKINFISLSEKSWCQFSQCAETIDDKLNFKFFFLDLF